MRGPPVDERRFAGKKKAGSTKSLEDSLIALVHTLSTLGLVLVLYCIIRGIFSTRIEQASHLIQVVTFGVIAVLGAVILTRRLLWYEHHHHHGVHSGSRVMFPTNTSLTRVRRSMASSASRT